MFDFGINVLLNPSSFIGPANQVISVINQLQAAISKFNAGTGGGSKGLESDFARLNQVAAQTKATFEGVASSSSNLRNAMGQIGQGASQASAGFSIFGQKTNEAITNLRNAETTFKSLGPAFGGIAAGSTQAGTALTNLGNSTRTLAAGVAPLAGVLKNFETQVTTTAGKLQLLGPVATQAGNAFRAGLANSVTATGAPLANLNSQLAGTTGGLNNVGSAATQSATGFGRLREMFQGNRGLVFGFSAFFGTLTGIAFELQLVNDANNQVAQSQAALNDLVAQGKQGTSQYSQAQQALAKDQRFLEFSTRNLALAFTNLVPDVLLMINGIIQLSEKFKTTASGATAMASGMQTISTAMTSTNTAVTATNTGMTALSTGMTTATSATTTFSAAGTAVTGSLTPMRGALQTTTVALAETVAAESNAILTSEGLVASNAGMGLSAQGASKAIQSIVPAAVATEGAEATLIEENVALGASFDALGVQAKAAGSSIGSVGKAGGIKGALSGLLGGGGALGIAGPIGLGVTAAFGFGEFLNLFAQQVKSVVDTRLLAEGEIEKANKGMSDSFAGLGSDIGTSIDEATGKITYITDAHTTAANTIIANNSRISQSSADAVVLPGAKKGQTVEDIGIAPNNSFFGPQQDVGKGGGGGEGPIGQAFPSFTQKGADIQSRRTQAILANRTEAQIAQMEKSLAVPTSLITQAGGFEAAEQQFAPTMPGRGGERVGMQTDLQRFMAGATQKGMIPTSDVSQKILPSFAGAKVVGELTPERLNKVLDLQTKINEEEGKATQARKNNQTIEAALHETKIASLIAEGKETLVNVEADKAAAKAQQELEKTQQATGKAVQAATENLHAHNESVMAMPTALAEATGQEIEMSRAIQTAQGVAVVYDNELANHIKVVGEQATAYTNANTAQSLNLKTQEELVKIGNAVVGGVEEELTHVTALNAFWGNLSTTMQDNIKTNQELTIASIDVTASLTNQAQNQFLVNEGLIAGKEAAQSFIEQQVVGVAQTEQYNKSLQEALDLVGVELPSGIEATSKNLELMTASVLGNKEAWKELQGVMKDAVQNAFAGVEKATDDLISQWSDPKKRKELKNFLDDFFPKDIRKEVLVGIDLKEDTRKLQSEFNTFMATLTQPNLKTPDLFDVELQPQIHFSEKEGTSFLKKWQDHLKDEFGKHINDPGSVQNLLNQDIQHALDQLGAKGKLDSSKVGQIITDIFNDPALRKAVQDSAGGSFSGGMLAAIDAMPIPEGSKEIMRQKVYEMMGGAAGITTDPLTVNVPIAITPIKTQMTLDNGKKVGVGSNLLDMQNLGQQAKDLGLAEVTKGKTGGDQGPPAPDIKPWQEAQKVISQISVNITKTVGVMVTSVTKEIATLGVSVVKVLGGMVVSVTKEISAMDVAVIKDIGVMNQSAIKGMSLMTVSVLKSVTVMVTSTVAAFSQMAVGSMKQVTILVTTVIAAGTSLMKGWLVSIAAMGVDTITAFEIMSKGVQTSVSNLWTVVTTLADSMKEKVITSVSVMQAQVVSAVEVMQEDVTTAIQTMADDAVEMAVNMDNNVVTAIEDMQKRGSKAAASFASSMESSLGKVETAANNAMSAVSNLADEVGQLDGMSATVTVTTNFKTTGEPPKQTGDVTINRQMGAVIDAASAKSFQYGGSIETSHGPQMAIFGDNPGGEETVAFIPHDNPFPTLRKLEKLFKGRSSSDIVDRAIGQAGEIIIHAQFVIENVMDGQKMGTTIARKVFKKMRTR